MDRQTDKGSTVRKVSVSERLGVREVEDSSEGYARRGGDKWREERSGGERREAPKGLFFSIITRNSESHTQRIYLLCNTHI